MNSQNTSFSQSPSAIDPDEARRRFLASMGIGDPMSEKPGDEIQEESKAEEIEEEVALSSSPDDLELTGAPKSAPSRSRVISYDVKPKTVVKEAPPVSRSTAPDSVAVEAPAQKREEKIEEEVVNEPAAEEIEAAPAAESQPMNELPEDKSGPLQLSCPKCQGDLVLMHEHIGIEGACVWCETKIVAARSGTDGEVRVFPLFQPDALKPVVETAPEPTPVEPKTEAPQEVSDMVSKADLEPAAAFPEAPEVEGEAEEEASVAAAIPESAPADGSGGFETPPAPEMVERNEATTPAAGFGEMPSGFGDSAPAPEAQVIEPVAEMLNGFGEPVGSSSAPAKPAESSPEPKHDAPESAPAGFADEFSSDPFASPMPTDEEAREKPANAEAPTDFSEGWGEAPAPVAVPSGFSEAPFSDDVSTDVETPDSDVRKEDEVAEASKLSGFSDAVAWGPPASLGSRDSSDAPVEKDGAPKSLEKPAGFQSGFEAVSPKADEISSEVEGPLWGTTDEAPAAWGTAPEATAPEATAPDATAPGSDFPAEEVIPPVLKDEKPSPASEESPSGFSSGFDSGFAIPASESGSFPSPEIVSPDEDDSIFSEAAVVDESGSDEIASWGSSAEGADSILEPEVKEATPAPEAKPQLFASASNSNGGSMFADQSAATSGPPPIPGAAAPAVKNGNGLFGGTPNVTSQPLGSKPAKKKGKGLIVFLVILLGLVCGAALASFVLPMDEYVGKARAFMEQKLNMESEVDPALFLSEMIAPGTATAPPEVPPGLEAATASAEIQAPASTPTAEPAPAPTAPASAPAQTPVAP